MQHVHLVNPMWDAQGGSEHRTLTLEKLLAAQEAVRVTLWSTTTPDPLLATQAKITQINAAEGVLPQGGTLVFIGIYFRFGDWLPRARAARVVVIVNTNNPAALKENLALLEGAGYDAVELVMTSTALWHAMGKRGVVLPSLIDVSAFPRAKPAARPFTIGRLSRDEAFKHHPEDVIVYQDVLARGGAVRLMGASTLRPVPRPAPSLTLQTAGSAPAADFLAGLDCFFYRTAPEWFETFGRVIHEAMCCGLPVLCHQSVGGAEHIRHGVNGLVFRGTGDALDCLDRLRRDASWRAHLGAAARESMLALHGRTLPRATLQLLLR